jgi:RNase P subunit RPR2
MANQTKCRKQELAEQYRKQVGAHNVETCKYCGWPYRYNNMGYHDKGYCSPECRDKSGE